MKNERTEALKEIWGFAIVLIAIAILISIFGCAKKQDLKVIVVDKGCESKSPYVFNRSDLVGTWQANKIIHNGVVKTVFEPKENVVIIEDDVIGVYFSKYYNTPNATVYDIIEDSVVFRYKLNDSTINKSFKFIYKHDSSLTFIGSDKRGLSMHFEMGRE